MANTEGKKLPVCENLNFAAKEAFKRLRTNVIMALPEDSDKCRIIGITSAQPEEGKSTVSLNLAYSLAELGRKVLLVDADMRRPSIHSKIGLNISPGLTTLLSVSNSISDAVQHYTNAAKDVSMDVICSGNVTENPSEMLASKRMTTLMNALSSAYDYIIIDLPPVGTVIDPISVSKRTDGMLIVVRENYCPRGMVSDCVSQLKLAKVNILGFVMNGAMEGAGKKKQYSSYYYY